MFRDIVNQLESHIVYNQPIVADGDTFSLEFDTIDFESGLYWSVFVTVYNDGDYLLSAQESDVGGFNQSDWDDVPTEAYCNEQPIANSVTGALDPIPILGVFSTKRYVRLKITASNVTSGANLAGLVTAKADYRPDPN